MSKEKYDHLIGRECVLQVAGGAEARGTVSDVGKDGVLFIHEDGSGVPLIAHDKIGRLVLAKDEPEQGQQGIGARTRQEGDTSLHAAPDEPPRGLPGTQQVSPIRQPTPAPVAGSGASPVSGPPARQPLRPGEIPAVPPQPEKDIDPRQQRGRG